MIWSFDCVLECRLLLLYWMWSSENLDGLNGGGWGYLLPQPIIQPLLSMGTPDSPVVHRTWHCSLSGACHVSRPLGFGALDRCSPLSSCDTGQFGGTPNSPVCSDFAALTSDFCTMHNSRPLRAVDRCSIGSSDMSGTHRTVRWIIAEWLWKNLRAASSWGALA
jgi:hypothetical protein